MDPNTFTNLVIVLMVIIIVLSAIKTVILHFLLDSIEEMIYLVKSITYDTSTVSSKLTELNTYTSFMSRNTMDIYKKLNDFGKKKEKNLNE